MTVYRWALVVAAGTLFTAIEVADGIAEQRVDYRGKLDAQEILEYYHPGPESPVARDYQRLSSAEGVVTKPAL